MQNSAEKQENRKSQKIQDIHKMEKRRPMQNSAEKKDN
jgi:hypothetical protein